MSFIGDNVTSGFDEPWLCCCFQDNSAAVWPCSLATIQPAHVNPLTWRNISLFQLVVSMTSTWVWWLTGLRDEPDVDDECGPTRLADWLCRLWKEAHCYRGCHHSCHLGFFMHYNRRTLSLHGLLKKNPHHKTATFCLWLHDCRNMNSTSQMMQRYSTWVELNWIAMSDSAVLDYSILFFQLHAIGQRVVLREGPEIGGFCRMSVICCRF